MRCADGSGARGRAARASGCHAGNSPLSGVLDFRSKPVLNPSAYEGQRTTDLNKVDAWENVGIFTSARFTLADLKPGTIYWARSRAIGSAGQGGVERCGVGEGDLRRG